jgi:ABC-type proline/glycine betaine transport system permease subunit
MFFQIILPLAAALSVFHSFNRTNTVAYGSIFAIQTFFVGEFTEIEQPHAIRILKDFPVWLVDMMQPVPSIVYMIPAFI